MIANYFLLAFRNLLKQRGYALVNIFGLAVGLGAAMLFCFTLRMNSPLIACIPMQKIFIALDFRFKLRMVKSILAVTHLQVGTTTLNPTMKESMRSAATLERGMPTTIHYIPKDKIVINGRYIILCGRTFYHQILSIPIVKGDQNNPLGKSTALCSQKARRAIFSETKTLSGKC